MRYLFLLLFTLNLHAAKVAVLDTTYYPVTVTAEGEGNPNIWITFKEFDIPTTDYKCIISPEGYYPGRWTQTWRAEKTSTGHKCLIQGELATDEYYVMEITTKDASTAPFVIYIKDTTINPARVIR